MVRKESADPKLAVSRGPHCRILIMKLTKKAAALLLAATLAVSVCAMPVFAEGPSTTVSEKDAKKEAYTNVNYQVDSKYTWSIPAKIDFGANAGIKKTLTVKADKGANDPNVLPSENNGYTGSAPMVCVTENIIAPENALKISIDTATSSFIDDKGFFVGIMGDLTIENMEKLYFKINKLANDGSSGDELNASKSEVLRVDSGTKTGKQALVFTLETTKDEVEKAGKYTGTIAFKSEVSSAKT